VETEESEEAGVEPCLLVKLWRTDMLTGVLELNASCGVVKADQACSLLFGLHQQQLQAAGLCRCAWRGALRRNTRWHCSARQDMPPHQGCRLQSDPHCCALAPTHAGCWACRLAPRSTT
jgi:hypothetical protein